MSDVSRSNAPSSADAERVIQRTRAELALTLDALGRKLAPQSLVEKGFDMLNDSLDLSTSINKGLGLVRDNPVPFALFGIGAIWLIANEMRVVDRLAEDQRVEAVRQRVAGFASDVGNRAGELASSVADRVGLGGTANDQALGHTGNSMVDKATARAGDGWVHRAADIAQGAFRSARDSGEAVLNQAGTGANRIADQLSDALERHPLVVGAAAVMAGAILAALLPMSRAENELFGSARDELKNKAQEAGEEAVTRMRDVATKAATRAVDAATDAVAETMKAELKSETNPSA